MPAGIFARLFLGAGALAIRARPGDHLAAAAALSAGAGHREEPLLIPQLTGAAALGTLRRCRARRRAVAFAALARFVTRDLDVCFDALGRLGKLDLEVVAQIGAALRPAAAAR